MNSINNYHSKSEDNFLITKDSEIFFKTSFKQYIEEAKTILNRALGALQELEQINKRIHKVVLRQRCGGIACCFLYQPIFNCIIPIIPLVGLLRICSLSDREDCRSALYKTPMSCCSDDGRCSCCCPSLEPLYKRCNELNIALRATPSSYLFFKDHPDHPEPVLRKLTQVDKLNEPEYINAAYSIFISIGFTTKDFIREAEEKEMNEAGTDESLRRLRIYEFIGKTLLSDSFILSINKTIAIRYTVRDCIQNLIPNEIIQYILLEYIVENSTCSGEEETKLENEDNLQEIIS